MELVCSNTEINSNNNTKIITRKGDEKSHKWNPRHITMCSLISYTREA